MLYKRVGTVDRRGHSRWRLCERCARYGCCTRSRRRRAGARRRRQSRGRLRGWWAGPGRRWAWTWRRRGSAGVGECGGGGGTWRGMGRGRRQGRARAGFRLSDHSTRAGCRSSGTHHFPKGFAQQVFASSRLLQPARHPPPTLDGRVRLLWRCFGATAASGLCRGKAEMQARTSTGGSQRTDHTRVRQRLCSACGHVLKNLFLATRRFPRALGQLVRVSGRSPSPTLRSSA